MSSPTYDDQLDLPSQEMLKGVEELENSLTQAIVNHNSSINEMLESGFRVMSPSSNSHPIQVCCISKASAWC